MARKQIEVNIDLSSIGIFPTHWKECRLEDVCILVTDGTHDSPKESLDGFPLVTGKSIKGRFIDFSNTYNISSEDHAKVIARSKAEKGDLLFANIGNSIGDLVRIDTKREFSIKNLALFKPIRQSSILGIWNTISFHRKSRVILKTQLVVVLNHLLDWGH